MKIEILLMNLITNYIFVHDMLPIYQLGGGRGDNDMFPEIDSNWKVCEKCLPSDI